MINFIILTYTLSKQHEQLTNNLVTSLINANTPTTNNYLDKYRIIAIETNQSFIYSNENIHTIKYDLSKYNSFNYNHAINQAVNFCLTNYDDNDWFCILNNDVIVDKNWLVEIDNALTIDPSIDSICPSLVTNKTTAGISYGYALHRHFIGCCYIFRKSVYEKLKEFDEYFDFYFQDDDYLECLRIHNIKNAMVLSSKITHLTSATAKYSGKTYNKLIEDSKKFISKYGIDVYIQREKEKRGIV